MSDLIPNSFQTPNTYIDRYLAYLTAEEYKILSYIARRIFGFQKRQDRISISQMVNGIIKGEERLDYGTGLGEKTIKRALAELIRFKLVNVIAQNDPTKNQGRLYSLQLDSKKVDYGAMVERADKRDEAARKRTESARKNQGGGDVPHPQGSGTDLGMSHNPRVGMSHNPRVGMSHNPRGGDVPHMDMNQGKPSKKPSKKPRSSASSRKRDARPHKPYSDLFCESYKQMFSDGLPYEPKKGDFVQLANLRREAEAKSPDWLNLERFQKAVDNYLKSELAEFTLADLASRFRVFYKGPVDRFDRRPKGETQNVESKSTTRLRRTAERWSREDAENRDADHQQPIRNRLAGS